MECFLRAPRSQRIIILEATITFGDDNVFGKGSTFGAGVSFGDKNVFGKKESFGPGSKFGSTRLSAGSAFQDGVCIPGRNCHWEGQSVWK